MLTDRETDIARQMLAQGDKKRALIALRKKKYQESLLAKTDAQLEQLEKLTANVEFAQIQKDVVFGLQQGTKVLKEIHAEMGGLEHVEKLMGETADAIAYQNVSLSMSARLPPAFETPTVRSLIRMPLKQEVSEMLGGKISNQDEDEVEDELAALEAEMKGTEHLPRVPDTKLPSRPESAERLPAKAQQEPERQAMLA